MVNYPYISLHAKKQKHKEARGGSAHRQMGPSLLKFFSANRYALTFRRRRTTWNLLDARKLTMNAKRDNVLSAGTPALHCPGALASGAASAGSAREAATCVPAGTSDFCAPSVHNYLPAPTRQARRTAEGKTDPGPECGPGGFFEGEWPCRPEACSCACRAL